MSDQLTEILNRLMLSLPVNLLNHLFSLTSPSKNRSIVLLKVLQLLYLLPVRLIKVAMLNKLIMRVLLTLQKNVSN